jgi:putative tryptophan/tyrosine transport system substrate-binding protein
MSRLTRRSLLAGSAALALAPDARAQDRTFRITMLLWRGWDDAAQGFRDYLDQRGVKATYQIRDAEQERERVGGFVQEIRHDPPDLVFIWGTTTALEALGTVNATSGTFIETTPVVFTIVTEPLANGLVRDYARPGRNATGVLYLAPVESQMRTMLAYRAATRVGAIYNPAEKNAALTVDELKRVGERLGFATVDEPIRLEAGRPVVADIPSRITALKRAGVDWLYIPPDSFLNSNRGALTGAALDQKLPSFASAEAYMRAGKALAGLVSRYYNCGQFAGFKAAQILLEGKQPEQIPVEPLNRFSLTIRMQTAKALDLYPPLSLLRYAEIV